MTLIISWFNNENPNHTSIWTIGDTQITGDKGTLTLEGAKILDLTLKCKDITGLDQKTYYERTFTYAYAGSSLIGLNVFTALHTILANVGGSKEENNLPDLNSLIALFSKILLIYFQSIRSPIEILIAGFNPKSNEPFQVKLKPKLNDLNIFEIETIFSKNSTKNLSYLLLGDEIDKIEAIIDTDLNMQTIHDIHYWRSPQRILRNVISSDNFKTIGGNIQLSIVNILKQTLYAIRQRQSNSKPYAFRNLDVYEDIGFQLGECVVAIDGMIDNYTTS